MFAYNNTTKQLEELLGYDAELYLKLSTPVKVVYPPYHIYKDIIRNKYKLSQYIKQDTLEVIIGFNTWRSSYYKKFMCRKKFGNVFELFDVYTGRVIKFKEIYPLHTLEYHLLDKHQEDIDKLLNSDVQIQVNYSNQKFEFVDYPNMYNVVHVGLYEVNENTLKMTSKDAWSDIRNNLLFIGESFMGNYEIQFIKDYFPKYAEFYKDHYLFR